MKVINLSKSLIVFCLFIIHFSSQAQLNGIYTIGGLSPNYITIQSAITELNTIGVSGNVTFKIRTGTYNERVTIGLINGVSSTSQITFESETADSSDVWWISSSNSDANNYIVKCISAKYINFKNITFRNTGVGCGVFVISNGTSDFLVEGCHLKGFVPVNNFYRYFLISSANSADKNLSFRNNLMSNGSYGIILYGENSTERDSNILITQNVFTSKYGVYLQYANLINIEKNELNSTNNGIQLKYVRQINIERNKLLTDDNGIIITNFENPVTIAHNNVVSNTKALEIDLYEVSQSIISPTLIYNNFFIGRSCAVSASSTNLQIVNNSILNKYNWSGAYNALLLNSSATLRNNIISNESTGGALAIAFPSLTILSDYNLMYTNGLNLVYRASTIFTTLESWQNSVFAQDLHSWQYQPYFVSPIDLHILSCPYSFNQGATNPLINVDIDEDPRIGLPDIGADEFIQPTVDAGINLSYSEFQQYECPGIKSLGIKIDNFGTDTLVSANLNWSLNGLIQPTINWTGTTPYFQSSNEIDLEFNLIQDSFAVIKIWVDQPNGFTDINIQNDTLFLDTIWTKMSGVYFVGNSTLHYSTIQAASDDLHLRGTCNNVTLSIANGTYAEDIILDNLNRATDHDTLFFESTSGERDSVIWTQPVQYSWSIEILLTGNVIFRNITFIKFWDTSSENYHGCAHILNGAGPNRFRNYEFNNCLFTAIHYHSGRGIVVNGGTNVRINDCVFTNIYSGIEFIGVSGASNPPVDTLLEIKGNTFWNNAFYGIKVDNVRDIYIKDNYFGNEWDTIEALGTLEAIHLTHIEGDLQIDFNRIYGGYVSIMTIDFNGTDENPGRIENNFISAYYLNLNSDSFITLYGYNLHFNSNSMNVVHGIIGESFGLRMRSFVQKGVGDIVQVKNNSFKADSSIYAYFDFSPQTNTNVGFNNISVGDLSGGYDFDAGFVIPPNTTFFNPSYVSFSDLHLLSNELIGLGTDLGLTLDIDSNIRQNPPTIGAVEMFDYNYNLYLTEVFSIKECDSVKLLFNLLNLGTSVVDSAWIHYTINGNLLDSILLVQPIQPGQLIDSLIFAALPVEYDSLYSISVEVVLVDSIDHFSLNNFDTTTYYFQTVPSVDLIQDTFLCYGQHVELVISPSNLFESITWYNAGGSVENVNAIVALEGQNTVYAIDINGCEYFDTTFISTDPAPQLTISFDGDTLFGNANLVDWYFNGSLIENAATYTIPQSDGLYTYNWTSPNGCSYWSNNFNYSTVSLVVESIAEIVLYPNPLSDYLFIESSVSIKEICIYDSYLKLLDCIPKMTQKESIYLGVLPNGLYFVELKLSNGEKIIKRVIKVS